MLSKRLLGSNLLLIYLKSVAVLQLEMILCSRVICQLVIASFKAFVAVLNWFFRIGSYDSLRKARHLFNLISFSLRI